MSQNVGPLDAATGTWMSGADPFDVGGTAGPVEEPRGFAWDDDEDDWDDDEDWDEEDEEDDGDNEEGVGDDEWEAMFGDETREPLHRRRHFRDDD
jgi:hypothetical protein